MSISLKVTGIFLLGAIATSLRAAAPESVYELRIYTTPPGKMAELQARFREHTTKLFERHGMANVGYWLPADAAEGNKLYYVLRHASREAATVSWRAFNADPEWQAVRQASEANGPLVVQVDSIFLAPADYSPATAERSGGPHVFELRTYTTNDGKLEALDARFRGHTIALFARQGMTSLFYWHPTDAGKGAGRTLIYLLAHANPDAAAKSWAAFRADPEWIKVRDESEQGGKLLVPDGAKSVMLAPTDFSGLK